MPLLDLNQDYDYPPERAILDIVDDVAISGLARFAYHSAADVQFSLQNIFELLEVKENYCSLPDEWEEILQYQSDNLFAMLLYVYDKLVVHGHAWRARVISCTDGLRVRDVQKLVDLCQDDHFKTRLARKTAIRRPLMIWHPSTSRRRMRFRHLLAAVRQELDCFRRIFRRWQHQDYRLTQPRFWRVMVRTSDIDAMFV